jgi:hypothetical protein
LEVLESGFSLREPSERPLRVRRPSSDEVAAALDLNPEDVSDNSITGENAPLRKLRTAAEGTVSVVSEEAALHSISIPRTLAITPSRERTLPQKKLAHLGDRAYVKNGRPGTY